jgi:Tol biopolymer transport system component
MRKFFGLSFCVTTISLMLSACSVSLSEAPQATPISAEPSMMPFVQSTQAPEQSKMGNPLLPTTTIPVTWSNLNLTGKLVFVSAHQGSDGNPVLGIQALDLLTGVITTIFQGPEISWIYYVTVSPDEKQLIMAYAAPPENQNQSNELLYSLPLDGSTSPQLFVLPPTIFDRYPQVEWSPDGKYIYYVHNNYQNQPLDQHYPIYEIYRMVYPNGQPEKVADQAFWPRLSPDGSRLVYISMDPYTGKNKIFVASADGSNAQEVSLTGAWTPDIVDAPIFSPDGQSLIFSAPIPPESSAPSWVEKLLGIQIAHAHSIPSDWWSVPVTGGNVRRLTNIGATGLFASLSPDKRLIASYSGNGLFVMNPDGTNLTLLIPDMGGVPGTVTWIP